MSSVLLVPVLAVLGLLVLVGVVALVVWLVRRTQPAPEQTPSGDRPIPPG